MDILDNLKKRFIDSMVAPYRNEIAKRDEMIKILADKMEKTGDVPMHFAVPMGMGQEMTDNSVYRWKRILDFKTMRELSEKYDVARACINRRKRQVERVSWTIKPISEDKKPEQYKAEIDKLTKFLKMPGGKYSRFREFVAEIVEDLLVFDGGTIWKDKTRGGDLTKLMIVDTETIRLRVMDDGSTPEPPQIAYEQWVRGEKVAQFTTDDMHYLMMNPRSNSPYGFAPLEALVLGVDAALKAQLSNLSNLTEGNMPEGFYALPETWTPAQIKEFQTWFDSFVAGNPRYQQRIKFMPGGKGVGYTATKKPEDMRFLEYEEWLLKKTCALFDVPPEEIGFTEDVNRATGQVQTEVATSAGLMPLLEILKEFFDQIIQEDFNCPELEFSWFGLDKKDELRDAQIAEKMIDLGATSIDEWRAENDLKPIGIGPFIKGGPNGIILLDNVIKNPKMYGGKSEPKEQPIIQGKKQVPNKKEPKDVQQIPKSKKFEDSIEDLKKWKTKALADIKDGKLNFRKFETENIDLTVQGKIIEQLTAAKTKDDVRKIFDTQMSYIRQQEIMEQALELKQNISQTLEEYGHIE